MSVLNKKMNKNKASFAVPAVIVLMLCGAAIVVSVT